MDLWKHEYLIPIFIGNQKNNLKYGKILLKMSRVPSHLFADRFSLREKLLFRCHRVSPMRNVFLLQSIKDFIASCEEYCSPVIIIADLKAEKFIEANKESLESLALIRNGAEICVKEDTKP